MTTSFEQAFEAVSILVRDFAEHESHYLSPSYQEAEVRTDFLDKFWAALGWDVRHLEQTNPREQEVKVEKNPDSSASGRKADYAFYFKPDYKNPVFFCEAKKPSRKLGDPEFYFQLVRYGRGAGTPISVLTDFEEFHIVDCRYEPHIEKSYPSAQIEAFRYTDYLDRDKFGSIYWLFSREAVEQGKLKEFTKQLPKQRGKGKAKLTAEEAKPVDEAFLTKLEEYRLTLAKAFKKADESLNAEDLTEATQKVIDRLVFIRFLEDKNIESDYIIDQIAVSRSDTPVRPPSQTNESTRPTSPTNEGTRPFSGADRSVRPTAWRSFLAWSKELDVKYNGVVFKPHDIDKPTFKAPDDKVFAELCSDISHRTSKYIFSYIPIEILGSIYERFLGKVVTATAKRADIEYKPEVRKAGGVYYTPKYIVDYIVENTVGKILAPSPQAWGEGMGVRGLRVHSLPKKSQN
jgi:adenine-specific DNA-methyltransferase